MKRQQLPQEINNKKYEGDILTLRLVDFAAQDAVLIGLLAFLERSEAIIRNWKLRVNNILHGKNKINITMIKKGIKEKLVIVILLPLLTSCATYNSSFSCGDARGANCMSMDRVDRMIANGEIEKCNEKKKNCRGRKCKESEKHDTLLNPKAQADVSEYLLNGELK